MKKISYFIFVIFFFISLFSEFVYTQNPPNLVSGKTREIVLPPWGHVNAGPFIFGIDSDADGMPDSWEIQYGLNPNDPTDADADPDGDGLTNGDEFTLRTNPINRDTDGDGADDGREVRLGYDPLDPLSFPPADSNLVSIQISPGSFNLSLNQLVGSLSVPLKVTGFLSTGETIDLSRNPATRFQVLNSAIAGVDSLGRVFGLSPGQTLISATNTGLTASTSVTVTDFVPSQTAFLNLTGQPRNVEISGGYAFVASGTAGLHVVQIANPESPLLIATLPLPGTANDIRIQGNLAYLACGDGGLQIVNLQSPAFPTVVGGLAFGSAQDVAVSGSNVYVAAGDNGLFTIDCSNPNTPQILGRFSDPGASLRSSFVGVDVDGRGHIVAVGTADTSVINLKVPRIWLFDVAGSPLPTVLARRSFPSDAGTPTNVFVTNGSAFVSTDLNPAVFEIPSALQFGSAKVLNSSFGIFAGSDIEGIDGLGFVAPVGLVPLFWPAFDFSSYSQSAYRGAIQTQLRENFSCTGIGMDHRLALFTVFSPQTGTGGLHVVSYRQFDPNIQIAPEVSLQIQGLANNRAVVGQPLSIKVSATDDVAVKQVEILVNGVSLAISRGSEAELNFNAPGIPGTVTIEARATDFSGNVGAASPIQIQVVADSNPTTVIGRVVKVSGQSSQPLIGVDVRIDGLSSISTQTDGNGDFSIQNVGATPNDRKITVRVFGSNGDQLVRSISKTVVPGGVTDFGTLNRFEGQAKIQNPRSGEPFISGETFPIKATGSNVVSVTVDGSVLGNGTDGVFNGNLVVVKPAGSVYLLEARDLGFDGSVYYAEPRTVEVVDSDPLTTVRGRVVDQFSQPVVGKTVFLEGTQIEVQTDQDGSFTFPGIPTQPYGRLVSAIVTENGGQIGRTLREPVVRGGITDLGFIVVTPVRVLLDTPIDNVGFIVGENIPFLARASVPFSTISKVEFFVNGDLVQTRFSAPYGFTYTVPDTLGAFATVEARATAVNGNSSSASIRVPVIYGTDPLTTVTGQVVNSADRQPVAGALVKILDSNRTVVADGEGRFSFNGVPTTPYGSPIKIYGASSDGQLQGVSLPVQAVRGGTTDIGKLEIAALAVSLTNPANGQTVVVGEEFLVKAAVNFSVPLTSILFRVDGTNLGTSTSEPYQTLLTVPDSPGVQLVIDAVATDGFGNQIVTQAHVVNIVAVDPLTTVVGRVVDSYGNPVSGATVTSGDNSGTSVITGPDGTFALTGISTIPLGKTIYVDVQSFSAGSQFGRSGVVPIVRGGTTDVGEVVLASNNS